MKILFYTDMHWSGAPPLRRKDDYLETVIRKHGYIYDYANKHGIDLILNGGDINETPLVATSIINKQITTIQRRGAIPEFGIIGNHDVVGNNTEKIDMVSASILFTTGCMGRLSKDEPLIIETPSEETIAIFGVDIHKDMDNLANAEDYYVKRPIGVDYCILVAHGWLTKRVIEIEGLHHTTFEAVAESDTEADLILTGHFHPGHGVVRMTRKDGEEITFFNPGSPTRTKASLTEMERKVGFGVITINETGIHCDFIPFPSHIAAPAEEVLDRASLEREIEKDKVKQSMQAQYSGLKIYSTNAMDVIMEIAKDVNMSEEARTDLVERVEKEFYRLNEQAQREEV